MIVARGLVRAIKGLINAAKEPKQRTLDQDVVPTAQASKQQLLPTLSQPNTNAPKSEVDEEKKDQQVQDDDTQQSVNSSTASKVAKV